MTGYKQLLPEVGTKGYRLKKLFLVIGFFHFAIGAVLIIFLLHIYWTWAVFPLLFGCIGFIWGSLAYLFSAEFKYEYSNGIFVVYKKKSYYKYKEVFRTNTVALQIANKNGLILTNKAERVTMDFNGECVIISPDDYLKALLLSEKETVNCVLKESE